jgi:ribonuclease G
VDIGSLVQPGRDLLVQVLKDPLGTKGARLSTAVSLPSRFLVYMPFGRGVGVSARIEDLETREQLRTTVRDLAEGLPSPTARTAANGGGYIVRTAAHRAPPEALHADMLYLPPLGARAPGAAASVCWHLVHADPPLAARMLRDELSPEVPRDGRRSRRVRGLPICRGIHARGGARIEQYSGAATL